MAREHLVVIEDEEDILRLITYNLEKEGFRVTGVTSGEDALFRIKSLRPHLVLLDLMLPGIDGYDVCRQLKGDPDTRAIPVIILTAKGEETDVVTGLELGADDYITKPFSPRILIARIRAVLRRETGTEAQSAGVVKRGELVIDPGRHEVLANGVPVRLTATEFRILHLLINRPGWVFSRDQIVNAVHEENFAITPRAVDVQIVGLRKKLGPISHYIETVRGVGYRFKD